MNNEMYKKYLKYAEGSYWTPEQFSKEFGDKFKFYEFKQDGFDTQVYCYFGSMNELIFVFRGSDPNKYDWITNFSAWQIPYGNNNTAIRVHNGFYTAYKNIREFIWLCCEQFKMKPFISCVGHSQGGALAILAAVDIQYNFDSKNPYLNRIFCYTYGSPRVFNKEGMISYNNRVPNTFRVYNIFDVVPNVPFLHWGYCHVGNKVPLKTNWFNNPPFNHNLIKSYKKFL